MKYQLLVYSLLFMVYSCSTDKPEESGHVTVGGIRMYYTQQGEGDAVLLIHAGFQNHTMWEEQRKALVSKYNVITIDMPGHGMTEGRDTTILIADIIKTVLDSLRVEKTSIIGLSLGGAAAQDFAIAHPQRVNKLILLGSGLNGFDKIQPIDSVSSSWWPQLSGALEAKDTATAAKVFTQAWADGPYRPFDTTRPVSKYVFNTTLATMRKHRVSGWARFQTNPTAAENITAIKAPVLTIHGDKDQPYITAVSEYQEKKIPGAKRVLIKDVAHMLNMEKPEEINKLIIDFLEQR